MVFFLEYDWRLTTIEVCRGCTKHLGAPPTPHLNTARIFSKKHPEGLELPPKKPPGGALDFGGRREERKGRSRAKSSKPGGGRKLMGTNIVFKITVFSIFCMG